MEELRECPFCGGGAKLEHISGHPWDRFVVTCNNTKCCAFYIGYCDEGLYDTEYRAIAAWNKRAVIEEQDKWIPLVERKPEEGQNVHVSLKGGTVSEGLYTKRYGFNLREGIICGNGDWINIREINAWMPKRILRPYVEEEVLHEDY